MELEVDDMKSKMEKGAAAEQQGCAYGTGETEPLPL